MAKTEAIHFSDGEKAVCGSKARAVEDQQQVNCKKCTDIMAKQAQDEGDPLLKVRVKNLDLNDGTDFAFNFEGKAYRLINNAVHLLPKSVIKHLKLIAYPFKRYVPGQEPGQSMVTAGKRNRFAITEM